jgi:hypothetical protein
MKRTVGLTPFAPSLLRFSVSAVCVPFRALAAVEGPALHEHCAAAQGTGTTVHSIAGRTRSMHGHDATRATIDARTRRHACLLAVCELYLK